MSQGSQTTADCSSLQGRMYGDIFPLWETRWLPVPSVTWKNLNIHLKAPKNNGEDTTLSWHNGAYVTTQQLARGPRMAFCSALRFIRGASPCSRYPRNTEGPRSLRDWCESCCEDSLLLDAVIKVLNIWKSRPGVAALKCGVGRNKISTCETQKINR